MADKNKIQYSVVVPVYNSEGSLKLLHERLTNIFNSLNSLWELILVNDYSKDNSWEIAKEIAKKDAQVTAVNLTNNFGQHNALMCGFSYAKGEYVITIDDDLQHPPEEIPNLIKTLISGKYNVVYGQLLNKKYGWFRNLCSNLINNIISKITGSGYKVTNFRIIKNLIIEKIICFKQYNVMIDVLIKDIVNKNDIGHCPVEHHPRTIGKSNYSFKKLSIYALNMIFNYTLWPLRLATLLGLFFSFSGILAGIFFIFYYLFYGVSVPGWTSIFIAITFFFGTTLFILGIIGEYIGRMFLNINQKPQYCIKEVYKK